MSPDGVFAAHTAAEDLDRDVAAQEHRVKNITEAVVRAGWSHALSAALKEEERKLAALHERRSAHHQAHAHPFPPATVVRGYLRDLVGTLRRDPAAARDVLARHIEPLTLTPTPEGGYRLDGRLDLAAVVASHGGEKVLDNGSSGGVLLPLSSTSASIVRYTGRRGLSLHSGATDSNLVRCRDNQAASPRAGVRI